MFEAMLVSDPSILKSIARHFQDAQQTKQIPHLLGIDQHPQILALRREGRKVPTHKLAKCLNYVLYRADVDSQYRRLDAAASHNANQVKVLKKREQQVSNHKHYELHSNHAPMARGLIPMAVTCYV
jgi:hypothetical protein